MSNELMAAENVTIETLEALLKKASLNVNKLDETFIKVVMNEDEQVVLSFFHENEIRLTDWQQGMIVHNSVNNREKMFQKLNEMNYAYPFCSGELKFYTNKPNYNFAIVVFNKIRFNKGLNPNQFVDDIKFFNEVKNNYFNEFVNFLIDKRLLRMS